MSERTGLPMIDLMFSAQRTLLNAQLAYFRYWMKTVSYMTNGMFEAPATRQAVSRGPETKRPEVKPVRTPVVVQTQQGQAGQQVAEEPRQVFMGKDQPTDAGHRDDQPSKVMRFRIKGRDDETDDEADQEHRIGVQAEQIAFMDEQQPRGTETAPSVEQQHSAAMVEKQHNEAMTAARIQQHIEAMASMVEEQHDETTTAVPEQQHRETTESVEHNETMAAVPEQQHSEVTASVIEDMANERQRTETIAPIAEQQEHHIAEQQEHHIDEEHHQHGVQEQPVADSEQTEEPPLQQQEDERKQI